MSASENGSDEVVDSNQVGTLYPIFVSCSNSNDSNSAVGVEMRVDMPNLANGATAGLSAAQWDATPSVSQSDTGGAVTPFANGTVNLQPGNNYLVSSQIISSGEIDDIGTITITGADNQAETINFHDSVTQSSGTCESDGTISESAESP